MGIPILPRYLIPDLQTRWPLNGPQLRCRYEVGLYKMQAQLQNEGAYYDRKESVEGPKIRVHTMEL